MKNTALNLWIVSAAISTAAFAQTAGSAAGHWEGKIQIPNRELGFAVDLTRNTAGAWSGTIAILGTTSMDVPLATIAVDGVSVKFAADLPERATFDGKLSEDGSSIGGTAANAMGAVPFQLTRKGEAVVKLPPASSALTKDFEGAWEGVLQLPAGEKKVGLKMSASADGTAAATLFDSEGHPVPVTTVTLKDKELQLEVRAISGTYKGTLGANGEIAGEWTQGPSHVPLTFKRAVAEPKK